MIGLFKTEVIRHAGPWRSLDDVEYATLEWVAWFNTCRLLEPLGYLPPADAVCATRWAAPRSSSAAGALNQLSLRRTRGDSEPLLVRRLLALWSGRANNVITDCNAMRS